MSDMYAIKKCSLLLNLLELGFKKAMIWSTDPWGIPIESIIIINIILEYNSPISKKISEREKISPMILDVSKLLWEEIIGKYKKKRWGKPHLLIFSS